MDLFWWWWIAAVVLVVFELATGTVYLLMVAMGLTIGGVAAWLGHGFAIQILVASVIAAAGCLVVRRMRERQPKQIESQRNADVQIDLGNTVVVDVWQTDRTAQVQYRGAQWSAMLDAEQVTATSGVHSIVAMQGNTLVLKAVTT